MKGTELRSFSDFQILTKIAYSDISEILKMVKFESKLDLQVFSR